MRDQAFVTAQQELLTRLRTGDRKVITYFYNHLWNKVLAWFRNKRYPEFHLQLLEDCFSSAFLTFLEKIKSPDFKAHNLEGFAFRIVQNTFRDQLKRPRWAIAVAPEKLPERPNQASSSFLSWAQLLADREEWALLQWFQTLPQHQQQILDLRFQGYSLKEIALILRLSFGTVRNTSGKLMSAAKAQVNLV